MRYLVALFNVGACVGALFSATAFISWMTSGEDSDEATIRALIIVIIVFVFSVAWIVR